MCQVFSWQVRAAHAVHLLTLDLHYACQLRIPIGLDLVSLTQMGVGATSTEVLPLALGLQEARTMHVLLEGRCSTTSMDVVCNCSGLLHYVHTQVYTYTQVVYVYTHTYSL